MMKHLLPLSMVALCTLSVASQAAEKSLDYSINAKNCLDRLERNGKLAFECGLGRDKLNDSDLIIQGDQKRMRFSNCTLLVVPSQDEYRIVLTKDGSAKRRQFKESEAVSCLKKGISVGHLDKQTLNVVVSDSSDGS